MRASIWLLFIAVFSGVFLQSVSGAERTWTIARDIYTADAELVAVRGNVAYLKMGGKVEEVPLENLSAIDQEYIASLSLAPILPGPAAAMPGPAVEMGIETNLETAVAQEEMPLPGQPDTPASDLELNAPDLAPAYGGTPLRTHSLLRTTNRVDQYGRAIPPQPGVRAGFFTPDEAPRTAPNANPNDRRYRRPPQTAPNAQQPRANRDDDDDGDDDDRPGLFGLRRLDRQRAAAARSR
jgi:hypothetical protein